MPAENARKYINMAVKILNEQSAQISPGERAIALASLAQAEALVTGIGLDRQTESRVIGLTEALSLFATAANRLAGKLDEAQF